VGRFLPCMRFAFGQPVALCFAFKLLQNMVLPCGLSTQPQPQWGLRWLLRTALVKPNNGWAQGLFLVVQAHHGGTLHCNGHPHYPLFKYRMLSPQLLAGTAYFLPEIISGLLGFTNIGRLIGFYVALAFRH